ncbi:MAG: hypothetical protein AB7U81_05150 [Thiohalomonadaceae bacterium]
MKLVITIDTEEDNWLPFNRHISTRNAREIGRLHDLFVSEGVIPTYLVTWPMANDDYLVDTLADERLKGRCEIGAHCHPWTTPPVNEAHHPPNSMLCNLERELVAEKLHRLHNLLSQRFNAPPRTFRAGRWGFGVHVADVLRSLGYRVDTSVTAYTDWSSQHGPDYSLVGPQAYRFAPPNLYEASPSGTLIELPASVGFLRGEFGRRARVEKFLRTRPWRRLRLIGLLKRLSLHQRATLSPECATTSEMTSLIDAMQMRGYEYANLFFHSPTLVPGLTPFLTTTRDRDNFLHSLRAVLRHAKRRGLTSIPASAVTIAGGAQVAEPEAPAAQPSSASPSPLHRPRSAAGR